MEEDFREELIARELAACASDMRALTAMARRVAAKNEAALARLGRTRDTPSRVEKATICGHFPKLKSRG